MPEFAKGGHLIKENQVKCGNSQGRNMFVLSLVFQYLLLVCQQLSGLNSVFFKSESESDLVNL